MLTVDGSDVGARKAELAQRDKTAGLKVQTHFGGDTSPPVKMGGPGTGDQVIDQIPPTIQGLG